MNKRILILLGLLTLAGCSDYQGWVYPNGINNDPANFTELGKFDSWSSCESAGNRAINSLNSEKDSQQIKASFECGKNCKPYRDLWTCQETKTYFED